MEAKMKVHSLSNFGYMKNAGYESVFHSKFHLGI